jgi:hypothetical protein
MFKTVFLFIMFVFVAFSIVQQIAVAHGVLKRIASLHCEINFEWSVATMYNRSHEAGYQKVPQALT